MTNEYELADDDRQRLIYTKEQLMAPLLPGMERRRTRCGSVTPSRTTTSTCRPGPGGRPRTRRRTAREPSVPTAQAAQAGAPLDDRLATAASRAPTSRSSAKWCPVTTTLAAAEISTGEAVAFWILGADRAAGAFGMVLARNAVHSALFLVMTMCASACFYFIQEAPFLGVVQIIVYTGAIMICSCSC